MATPSAVARVFATAELLEKILLCVMHIPKYPGPRRADSRLECFRENYITDSFGLKRVSRYFNQSIIGSSRIQHALLTPRVPQRVHGMESSLHRAWWIGNVSGLLISIEEQHNKLHIYGAYCIPKSISSIFQRAEASWRKIKYLEENSAPVVLILERSYSCGTEYSQSLPINQHYTLGELYEELFAMYEDI
ncbi:hypothetical protein AC578_1621 [Pseudocercospora eumusae]|uniref:Uncharacterized protein n=1 Tax=Pseudocercospora eumusae TaxID=321146 RepID=A0A139HMB0_9PEZI|nr:hypothetical protein AC578_1621 [Pseudocercospora eumusae]